MSFFYFRSKSKNPVRPAFYLLLFVIGCFGCQKKSGQPVSAAISRQVMSIILLDVHIEEARYQSAGNREAQNLVMSRRYSEIFKKHEVSFEEFDQSMKYYMQHPDEMDLIYEEIVNRLTALETEQRIQSRKADGE
jgi:hypothetical protein